jgi:hypothetical protein
MKVVERGTEESKEPEEAVSSSHEDCKSILRGVSLGKRRDKKSKS